MLTSARREASRFSIPEKEKALVQAFSPDLRSLKLWEPLELYAQHRCPVEVSLLLFVADRFCFRKKKLPSRENFFHRRAANTFLPGYTARAELFLDA